MKTCRTCQRAKPLTEFNKHPSTKDGFSNQCRACKSARAKQLYQQRMSEPDTAEEPATKRCTKCGDEKSIDEFDKRSGAMAGRSSHCKTCHKAYHARRHLSGALAGGTPGWNRLMHSAKARQLEFSLSLEFFVDWWNNTVHKCYYCHSTLDDFLLAKEAILDGAKELSRFREAFKNPMHAKIVELSVDRKNPDGGYTPENIAKACWICNYIKGGILREQEMVIIAPIIRDTIQGATNKTRAYKHGGKAF